VPPPGELDETYTSFIRVYSLHYMETQPEIHNVPQCREKGTEPRRSVTYTENLVKFGIWFSDIRVDRRTDEQADKNADHNTSYPYRGRSKTALSRSEIQRCRGPISF